MHLIKAYHNATSLCWFLKVKQLFCHICLSMLFSYTHFNIKVNLLQYNFIYKIGINMKKHAMAKKYRNSLLDPEKDFLHLGFEIELIEAPPTIERKKIQVSS